ncbi:2',3'-cyclic-nucleotide 2'-phosphodiesterase CvfA [Thermacetogenium phaeum DSM 12270]|uniref:Ribonuclease Y n=1 Tax=Thermacetogenium phaeum (strain ATCC BAA-254 / DSM 26808 / PB) TaxID=1089553 RepID=K4LEB9_THEPS|nr:2',3'-cyclic-nucleotide 2'-phosphodiesterase CvfA [Thermacetogenium phaeum DSM 12270]MDN5365575.1 ribonucrease [Thermacetogenium sp.]
MKGISLTTSVYVVLAVIALLIGVLCGYLLRKYLAEARIASAEEAARRIIEEAQKEADAKKREAILEAKEEIHQMRTDAERENRERRNEIQRQERRLLQKEEALDRKLEGLEKKEENLYKKEQELAHRSSQLDELLKKHVAELERISGLTTEEARTILLNNVREEIKRETALIIKEEEARAKEEADKRAREIVTLAIQKGAADIVAETTVSVVPLPNDEMKGRIIGREGRNIRTLETLTGVDLIIDDTPEAVILSSFDPIRRETARIALEKLIADGRIHPARIEEMVEKAQKEIEQKIREEGEEAAFEVGVHNIHPELIKLLGRLKFRTSYGQNVLKHSLEVAYLAGAMASELGANAQLAKRAGLLHDIGKAVDHEIEGPHVTIGADLARKYRENPEVIHCILAHHGDQEPETVEAVLIQAADAISAARPGARRETLEAYLKRLDKLEEIADSFEGVEKSFAIQAGREVRILVKPEVIDDIQAAHLSREIVKKIEDSLEYPGQIKVTVIRETRYVDYAK